MLPDSNKDEDMNHTGDNISDNLTSSTANLFKVVRPYYEQEQLNSEFKYSKPYRSVRSMVTSKCKSFSPKQFFLGMFPILTWLPNYSIKTDLVADIITGCTVAVMHIPQGMGYAMLASVPPICGIYMAFFPVLVYVLLGTSKHVSMGTFAVVSIMVGKSVLQHSDPRYFLDNFGNSTADGLEPSDLGYSPIQVGSAVCFVTGVIHIFMYIFRMGIISSLLSETLVSGFTTGAAIHVLTSQVKDMLGISLKGSRGNFEVVLTFIEIFEKIGSSNYVTVLIAATTICIMIANNDYLKPWISKKTIMPVPIELILVISGTLASQYLDLNGLNNVIVIGNIPTGLPAPQVPPFSLMRSIALDAFIIAMVAYTVTVSMALIFAQKLNYEVNFNQELLAMGGGNLLGSFFSCFPYSASLSRSTIQQTVGGRTQLASLISCGLLVIVLLWIAPFFELLPRCVLAGIIVVSLKGLLMQTKQFFTFWKLSRLDALVWLCTFLAVVFIAIDIGLLVGIILSLACIFVRGMKPYTCLLGNVPQTDLYLDITRYKRAEEIPSIKIFHYCGSLNFASRNSFKTDLCEKIGIELAKVLALKNKTKSLQVKHNDGEVKCVIIDFSALSYIDPSGVTAFKLIVKDFEKLSIFVYVAGCSCPVYEMMHKCGLKESPDKTFLYFPTVHDAVHFAMDSVMSISILSDN